MTAKKIKTFDAVARVIEAHAPAARIQRLRENEALLGKGKKLARWVDAAWEPKADELARWFAEAGQRAPAALIAAIGEAEKAVTAAYANRGEARQAGPGKKRGSRTPNLDEWLNKQDLNVGKANLWLLLPEDSGRPVYRDGEEAFEDGRRYNRRHKDAGQQHPITRATFDDRVDVARRRKNPVSN